MTIVHLRLVARSFPSGKERINVPTNFSRNETAAAGSGLELVRDAQVLGSLLLECPQRLKPFVVVS